MENMEVKNFWENKKVLITGHTGFKGSWLTSILATKKAQIFGLSLNNKNPYSLYNHIKNKISFHENICNILNKKKLNDYVNFCKPDIIFHMAAQPLVRYSYTHPILTWKTNTLGTINLLNSAFKLEKKCSVVFVTTDKVYENKFENDYGFKETDRLGGLDPYSSSKSASELAIYSWAKAYKKENINIASARAGNVLGGGDWAKDRLIPDIIKSLEAKKVIKIRNPKSSRPWQHVLDCLSGYMTLAEYLYADKNASYYNTFNFGPDKKNIITVEQIIKKILKIWKGSWIIEKNSDKKIEAQKLFLSNKKAKKILKWKPILDIDTTIKMTLDWYKNKEKGLEKTLKNINYFYNCINQK